MNGSARIDLADASDIANTLSSSLNEDDYATMRDMEPSTHHCSGPQAASTSYDSRFKFCRVYVIERDLSNFLWRFGIGWGLGNNI